MDFFQFVYRRGSDRRRECGDAFHGVPLGIGAYFAEVIKCFGSAVDGGFAGADVVEFAGFAHSVEEFVHSYDVEALVFDGYRIEMEEISKVEVIFFFVLLIEGFQPP